MTAVKVIARWSDMERLVLVRSLIGMWSVAQTRSRTQVVGGEVENGG